MSNLVNIGDFIDTWTKLRERGTRFVAGKFNPWSVNRTRSAFNDPSYVNAGFWIIPEVVKQWNKIITGNENVTYEDYFVRHYLKGKTNLTMLSPGCGNGSHELSFAQYTIFKKIIGIDLTHSLINEANKKVKTAALRNIEFRTEKFDVGNFHDIDIIHFHQSLHHFNHVDTFLRELKSVLKKDGYLIVHEYVGPNRFQMPGEQLKAINDMLKSIPDKFRQRAVSNTHKNRVYCPGLLRMYLADPSEAIDSSAIMSALHENFQIIQENNLGGNLLMLLFKDLAHHFINEENESESTDIIRRIIKGENKYLLNRPSDFVFGIYKNA